MKIVILDGYTLNPEYKNSNQIDFSSLENIANTKNEVIFYERTSPTQTIERIADAQIGTSLFISSLRCKLVNLLQFLTALRNCN